MYRLKLLYQVSFANKEVTSFVTHGIPEKQQTPLLTEAEAYAAMLNEELPGSLSNVRHSYLICLRGIVLQSHVSLGG